MLDAQVIIFPVSEEGSIGVSRQGVFFIQAYLGTSTYDATVLASCYGREFRHPLRRYQLLEHE